MLYSVLLEYSSPNKETKLVHLKNLPDQAGVAFANANLVMNIFIKYKYMRCKLN